MRGILQNDYGVDLDRLHWVTFEDGHGVGEVRADGPVGHGVGVQRAHAGDLTPFQVVVAAMPATVARRSHSRWGMASGLQVAICFRGLSATRGSALSHA